MSAINVKPLPDTGQVVLTVSDPTSVMPREVAFKVGCLLLENALLMGGEPPIPPAPDAVRDKMVAAFREMFDKVLGNDIPF